MHFNVQQKYFNQIKQGLKTAEGRINKPKFKDLNIGDLITFSSNNNPSEAITARIIYLNKFDYFKKMLESELHQLLPDVNKIEEAIKIYEGFGTYREDQHAYGVISIGFKLI